MALVNERSTTGFGGGPGRSFWGLVQQNGPWATTAQDRRHATGRARPTLGGGIGFGGTRNAGNGNFRSLTNPYQQNGSLPPPVPSKYAQRNIVSSPLDQFFKNNSAGRRMPSKPCVGSRQPMQTGHKLGNAQADQDFQGGSYGGGDGNAGTAPSPMSEASSPEQSSSDSSVKSEDMGEYHDFSQNLQNAIGTSEPQVFETEQPFAEAFQLPEARMPGGYEFLGHAFASETHEAHNPMEVNHIKLMCRESPMNH